MHANPTKPQRTERSAAWTRGYAEARRDAAALVEHADPSTTTHDLANLVREMNPRPGARAPKEK